MAKVKLLRRRNDGRTLVMHPFGLVRKGDLFAEDEVNKWYKDQAFFSKVTLNDFEVPPKVRKRLGLVVETPAPPPPTKSLSEPQVERSPQPPPIPTAPEPAPEPAPFPIDNYDDMNSTTARAAIKGLTLEQLERVREHEKSTKDRVTVLRDIDEMIDEELAK